MTVVEADEATFGERVLDPSRDAPVLVDFWAGWCRPCLVLGPILERLAAEYEGRFRLAKVDVDANPGLAARFGVQGIPAVKAFRDGEVVDEFVGAQPEEAVRAFLDGLVPSPAEPVVREGARAESRGDRDRAEELYRRALGTDPGHRDATVGLARVLLERGDGAEARALLGRVPGDEEGRRLLAIAELAERAPPPEELERLRASAAADPPDVQAALAVAAAEARAGDPRAALERCLGLLRAVPDRRGEVREAMVRIFEALGDDHPLTRDYRPRLASALF